MEAKSRDAIFARNQTEIPKSRLNCIHVGTPREPHLDLADEFSAHFRAIVGPTK